MDLDSGYALFIQHHLNKRSGERRRRLERGHQIAEKLFCYNVWWPVRGSFHQLHPEYEVTDWKGQSYFIDFAWIMGPVKLAFEIKGFGPHVIDMDRDKYCRELNRETFLAVLGYQVISFSYDDVAYRPDLCTTLLRMLLSRYLPPLDETHYKLATEREAIKLACYLARPLRPIDLKKHFGLTHRAAVQLMQPLCAKGWFTAHTGKSGKHVVRYEMNIIATQYL